MKITTGHSLQNAATKDSNMPYFGFGTASLYNDVAIDAIITALETGYRHIDTASWYKNEEEVGRAVKRSGIPRDEVFIVSKINPEEFDRGTQPLLDTLERLDMDYVDQYLIHWPGPNDSWLEVWSVLQEQFDEGLARSIGVSSFNVDHLEMLQQKYDLLPAANQIEIHPQVYQESLDTIKWCRDNEIFVVGFSPLDTDHDHPTVVKIAEQYQRSPVQVLLRWSIQHRFGTIPRSSSDTHIRENAAIFDFELSDEDMKRLDQM